MPSCTRPPSVFILFPLHIDPEMSDAPLLQLKGLACYKQKGQPIFTGVNLTVNEGEVLVLQGKSGCGYVDWSPARIETK